MTIEQIRYFIALSRTLNFTQAASSLYVAQPSFSKQIQNLEKELGVLLVKRDHRNVSLTQEGEVFRSEFSRILAEVDLAVERVKSAGRKEIRIAIFQPFSTDPALQIVIARLIAAFPDVNLKLYSMKIDEILRAYRNYTRDLFLLPTLLTYPLTDSESVPVGTFRTVIVTPKSDHAPDSPQALSRRKLILLDDNITPGLSTLLRRWLSENKIHPAQTVICGDLINTLMLPGNVDAFSFLNYSTAALHRDKFDLLELPDQPFDSELLAVWHKEADFFRSVLHKPI